MKLVETIYVHFRFVNYTGRFMNFMITGIDVYGSGHICCYTVNVSYVLRIFDYPYTQYWKSNPEICLPINNVVLITKFDEGTIPEFDHFVRYIRS